MPYLIPDDWDGVNWACYKLTWPNSPEWDAILRGLISSLSRGRNWDRRSGIIIAAQSVGWDIWQENYPFNQINCNDESPVKPVIIGTGGVTVLGDESMGQVVTDVTIENGILYVWFGRCCKQAVGAVAIDPPPSEIETDPTVPSTWPCNKARGMADNFANLVVTGIGALTIGDSDGDNTQAWNAALPQFSPLSGFIGGAVSKWSLARAEIEGDVLAENFADRLACLWADVCEPTNSLSSSEFSGMKTATLAFSSNTSIFLGTLMDAYELDTFAWWANAYHLTLGDCTCPGAESGPTAPTENGWYLSAAMPDLKVDYVDQYNTIVAWQMLAIEDVYGYTFELARVGWTAGIARQTCSQCSNCADFDMWHNASENVVANPRYAYCNDTAILDEIYGAGGYTFITNPGVVLSAVIASPTIVSGDNVAHCMYASDGSSGDFVEIKNFRFIHNENSPSHS